MALPRAADAATMAFGSDDLARAVHSFLDENADKRMAAVARQWAQLRRTRVWRGHSGHVRRRGVPRDDERGSRSLAPGSTCAPSQVMCMAVLPNGQIVSGSYDKSLIVWDASDGRRVHQLKGHTGWARPRRP